MDLGATICLPRRPRCPHCPWRRDCAAYAAGIAERLPLRRARSPRPIRYGVVFWAVAGGAVLLRRRPDEGLLGGMMEMPTTEWRLRPWTFDAAAKEAPVAADWRALPGEVRHLFTHIDLRLTVLAGRARRTGGDWCLIDRLGERALPTLMKKVARHALAHA